MHPAKTQGGNRQSRRPRIQEHAVPPAPSADTKALTVDQRGNQLLQPSELTTGLRARAHPLRLLQRGWRRPGSGLRRGRV